MSKDTWETPPDLFANLQARFPFVLDAAATASNTKCPEYLADSLAAPWALFAGGRWVWCNPPYSNPAPFVDQAVAAVKDGTPSCVLVNSMTSAAWYHHALEHCAEVWLFKGRIAFVDPDIGEAVRGNDRSQTIFVFDPARIGERKVVSADVKHWQPSSVKRK